MTIVKIYLGISLELLQTVWDQFIFRQFLGRACTSQGLQAPSYVVGANYSVLIYCTSHFQSGSFCLFQLLLFTLDLTCSSFSSILRQKLEEGNGTPLQYSCLENPTDGGTWKAAVHGVAKSQKRLSDFTFPFHFHALEKEMATHSSVLAWRIPGTGEPGWAAIYGVTQSQTQLK